MYLGGERERARGSEICCTDLKLCQFKLGGKGREPIGVARPRGKLPVAMTTRGKGGGQGSGGPEHKSSVVRGTPLSTVSTEVRG